ncbi:unnamed protein product, partial [Ectocarpus sp. 13 AM-2016]
VRICEGNLEQICQGNIHGVKFCSSPCPSTHFLSALSVLLRFNARLMHGIRALIMKEWSNKSCSGQKILINRETLLVSRSASSALFFLPFKKTSKGDYSPVPAGDKVSGRS